MLAVEEPADVEVVLGAIPADTGGCCMAPLDIVYGKQRTSMMCIN